jgi:cobaltochelatase CobN
VYDVYVADEYDLEMSRFFEEANPAGRQNLVARLLEVDRQGTYTFTPAEREILVGEYVRLVSKLGPACSGNTCGNRKLQAHVMAEARRMSGKQLSGQDVEAFSKELAKAFEPWPAARRKKEPQAQPTAAPGASAPPDSVGEMQITKIEMTKEEIARLALSARDFVVENLILILLVWLSSAAAGAVVAVYVRRRNRAFNLSIARTGSVENADLVGPTLPGGAQKKPAVRSVP